MSADQKLEDKLKEIGIELPAPPKAVGVYKPAVTVGNLVHTSGHVPVQADGNLICGCVGDGADEKAGYDAARQCGLAILATLKHHLGSLDKVERVIKIVGMVNATSSFTGHPAVINGCSELFKDVFGEAGVGARSAVGMSGLPLGVMVEIEAIVEIKA